MSTSFLAVDSAILTRFRQNFTEAGVEVMLPNEASTTHDALKWVRVTILHGDGFQASVNSPRMHRRSGDIIFSVFTRPNIGFGEGMRTVDLINAIYQGVSESSPKIRYRTPYLNVLGLEGNWYGMNLHVPFEWDSTE
jgi:hypothetical protein